MKKLLACFVIISMLFLTLASCNDNNEDETDTTEASQSNNGEESISDNNEIESDSKIDNKDDDEKDDSSSDQSKASNGLIYELNSDKKGYTLKSVGTCKDKSVNITTYKSLPVTAIAANAFGSCQTIQSVNIGGHVKTINSMAFSGCNNLNDVTIGNGVTTIGNGAFSMCTALTKITLGKSVEKLDTKAFYGCENLTEITIDVSIKKIGESAFANCEKLTAINFKGSYNDWYDITKDENWDKNAGNYTVKYSGVHNDSSAGLEFKINSDQQSYTFVGLGTCTTTDIVINTYNGLPVTHIEDWACFDDTTITSVTFGDEVKYLGGYAFHNCSKLKKVTIGKNVETISVDFIAYSYNISELYFEGTVEKWQSRFPSNNWGLSGIGTNIVHCSNGDCQIYVR